MCCEAARTQLTVLCTRKSLFSVRNICNNAGKRISTSLVSKMSSTSVTEQPNDDWQMAFATG